MWVAGPQKEMHTFIFQGECAYYDSLWTALVSYFSVSPSNPTDAQMWLKWCMLLEGVWYLNLRTALRRSFFLFIFPTSLLMKQTAITKSFLFLRQISKIEIMDYRNEILQKLLMNGCNCILCDETHDLGEI